MGWPVSLAALALVLLAFAMLWAVPVAVLGGASWWVYQVTQRRGPYESGGE